MTFRVDLGNGQRGQVEAIGQEDEEFVGDRIAIGHTAQAVGVVRVNYCTITI